MNAPELCLECYIASYPNEHDVQNILQERRIAAEKAKEGVEAQGA
jgi:hypothetical protein